MLGLLHSCDIKRNVKFGTNGRSRVQTIYTGVPCLVLPMNHTTAIEHQFSIGRAYDIYFDDGQDVQPGDQLIYNSDIYDVRVTQPYAVPLVGHVRTLCEQEIA